MNRRFWIFLRVLPLWIVAVLVVPAALADDDDDDRGRRRGELVIPVVDDVRLDVEIISGRIEIEGWDKSEIRIRTRGGNLEMIHVESQEDWVSIRGAQAGVDWLPFPVSGGNVDLRIDVPRGAHIEAKTINGPIRAKDVEGRIAFQAANGEIDVRGKPLEAQLETVNARIEFRGECARMDARTVNGRIDLRGVHGEVVATTMNGSIQVRAEKLDRVDLRTLAGSIELEGELLPGARVFGKTYSGSIALRLPEDTSADFDVQSFSGSIRNDLGPAGDSKKHRRPGQRLEFEAGDGDGRVILETFSGSVRIRADD